MHQIVANILQSKSPLMVVLRYVLLGAVAMMGVLRLRILILAFDYYSPVIKDILQEYLMAKALAAGVNPYLPLPQLAERFIGPTLAFPHPAPYPPFTAIFSLPLLLFDVEHFDVPWFIFEVFCTVALACLLAAWAGRKWQFAALMLCLLFASHPVWVGLLFGQMSILLAALLLGAFLALRAGRGRLAGLLLGLSIALKLVTWPLLIYLVLKRQWRAAIAAAATALGLNLLAALAMGFGPIVDFYLRTTPAVLPHYQAYSHNYSLWSIGWRLFAGTGSAVFHDFHSAPPLIALPELAPITAVVLILLLLGWGLWRAWKTESLEIGYAMTVCICLLVSPIIWLHYFVILALPIAVLLRSLARRAFPIGPTVLAGLILLLIVLGNEHLPTLITNLSGGEAALLANNNRISFPASLLAWLPILQPIALAALLAYVGNERPAAAETTE